MFFRECKSCGSTLDPGEGRNGFCDDCLENNARASRMRTEMERILHAADFKQIELEDLLYEKSKAM